MYLIVVWGGEQPSRGMPGQGWRPSAEEPPRALREVERLIRNPEKLANADSRCWKDTLGRKRSFKTHRASLPYQERIGHCLARDQETLTWRIWTDYVREDLKGENIQKLPGLVNFSDQKTNKKEVWKSLVRASSSAQPTEEKKEERNSTQCSRPVVLNLLRLADHLVNFDSARRPPPKNSIYHDAF